MENKQGSILIVDDNEEMLMALKLFLSPHFSKIVTEKNPNLIPALIKTDFDLIIFDSSPILTVAEPQILSRAVDQTLVLIRWGKTPRQSPKCPDGVVFRS